jgi:protein-S-isoprenylcysteine O-methyltransferase Ste14
MQWLPELKLGWLNGWLLLAAFYLVFGALMLSFPKDVVLRLYSVAGWSRQQRILSSMGKVFSLSCLGILILSPLKIGHGLFAAGVTLFALGFGGMMLALWNYRSAPAGRPATQGLYRLSRNPQWISLATMLLGTCVAVGSWAAITLLLIAAAFYHFRILGEERTCLNRYGEPYQSYMRRVPRYLWLF